MDQTTVKIKLLGETARRKFCKTEAKAKLSTSEIQFKIDYCATSSLQTSTG